MTAWPAMRDPDRISRMLELVEEIWRKWPDLRLGQLIEVVGTREVHGRSRRTNDHCVFNVEDDKMERYLIDWLEKRS